MGLGEPFTYTCGIIGATPRSSYRCQEAGSRETARSALNKIATAIPAPSMEDLQDPFAFDEPARNIVGQASVCHNETSGVWAREPIPDDLHTILVRGWRLAGRAISNQKSV